MGIILFDPGRMGGYMVLYHSVIHTGMYTVRFSPEEERLIESYSRLTGLTISEIIRRFTIEGIEDEMDADMILRSVERYRANPRTYSFDKEMRRLGLE